MDDKDFVLAGEGWVQLTPCGEYPYKGAGVMQVIDREACAAMVSDFNVRKAGKNFPGVLVDFDHFSLDTEKESGLRSRRTAGFVGGFVGVSAFVG